MDKFFLTVVIVSIVAVVGGAVLMSGDNTDQEPIVASENTEVSLGETSYDWGTIGINDGNVEHVFEIKNEGSEDLILSDVTTSCTCTTAQVSIGEEQSPEFGMHTKSDYQLSVPAGETAKLKVVYDPAFHGPSGVGPINRQIKVKTNDADKPELNFMLTAMVRK